MDLPKIFTLISVWGDNILSLRESCSTYRKRTRKLILPGNFLLWSSQASRMTFPGLFSFYLQASARKQLSADWVDGMLVNLCSRRTGRNLKSQRRCSVVLWQTSYWEFALRSSLLLGRQTVLWILLQTEAEIMGMENSQGIFQGKHDLWKTCIQSRLLPIFNALHLPHGMAYMLEFLSFYD